MPRGGRPHLHPRRRGSDDAQRAGRRSSRRKRSVPPPRLHLPVWPFWTAAPLCEAVCTPLGIEPPLYRRRVDFFTKSRAFDISRARAELGYAPAVGLREGIRRTLAWYRAERRGSETAASSGSSASGRVITPSRPNPDAPRISSSTPAAGRRGRSTCDLVVGRPGWRALVVARVRDAAVAERARRARARAAQDALSRRCSARAAATSSSGRTSCCGIRTRSASATTW